MNVKNINKKTINTALKLGYTPVCALDKNKDFILKAKKENKFFVIKTDHHDNEVQILKILNQINIKDILIPKIYESSRLFLVEDYLPGLSPSINNLLKNIKVIRCSIESLHKELNTIDSFKQYTKDSHNKFSKLEESSEIWLNTRLKYWFSDDQSHKKYRFDNEQTNRSFEYFKKIDTKTIINFGAFSQQHFRIYKDKIGIFDLGGHIRFAPSEYDWAYLWWGYFIDKADKHNIKFWIKFIDIMSEYADNKHEFFACLIERLAGIAKDLTHYRNTGQNIKKINTIKNTRDKILEYIFRNII